MAKINVFFHPAAMEEYIASYIWYHEKGAHLSDAFEHEIERAIRLIVEAPERWPIYHENYRRVLVRRFPFSIIYIVKETDIYILAVAHGHRRPGYWKNRLKQ
jgi:plasmid stabilization system protein ParE